jgi:hypothetical protein
MTSSNSVDLSSLTSKAEMTRRERSLLDKLDKLFGTASVPDHNPPTVGKGDVPAVVDEPPHPPTPSSSVGPSSGSTSVKYALFALCSVCIQFALHYVSLISDTINSLFHDSSYIIKSICLFLLAYVAYKHIDRFL